MNPQHSDLLLLRKLLLEEAVEEISRSKVTRCCPLTRCLPPPALPCLLSAACTLVPGEARRPRCSAMAVCTSVTCGRGVL